MPEFDEEGAGYGGQTEGAYMTEKTPVEQKIETILLEALDQDLSAEELRELEARVNKVRRLARSK